MYRKKKHKINKITTKKQNLQIKVYRKIDTNVLKNRYKENPKKTRYNQGLK